MATSTQQKQELFKAIWAIAEDLRNSVDGWNFKSYVLGKQNVKKGFFGQELNITTYNLCRINMFLHNINYADFDIHNGDMLLEPYHWDEEPFDAIVSNPPYSTKWVGDDNPLLINDSRFAPAGVLAPKSKSDLAFTMHMLSWLISEVEKVKSMINQDMKP